MIGGVLIAINVTFAGNRAAAKSSGGALYSWNARNILLSGVTFKEQLCPSPRWCHIWNIELHQYQPRNYCQTFVRVLANRAEGGGGALSLRKTYF